MTSTATIHQIKPAAVDAKGSLPAGVTVHQFGEVPARSQPRNLLERAAMCECRDFAASLLMTILHIKPENVVKANLPEPMEWARLPVEARLQFIGDWLRAECFELMDFTTFDKPADMTIGD